MTRKMMRKLNMVVIVEPPLPLLSSPEAMIGEGKRRERKSELYSDQTEVSRLKEVFVVSSRE